MQEQDTALLKSLCNIHAPSGNEGAMRDFILDYARKYASTWEVQPKVIHGEDLQDCVILVFSDSPKTAIFAHMDSVGFTVRYGSELVKIGGSRPSSFDRLKGKDSKGEISCHLKMSDKKASYSF